MKKMSPIIILVLSFLAGAQTSGAAMNHTSTDREGSEPQMNVATPQSTDLLSEVLNVHPEMPLGPREILANYDLEMANITRRMSGELGVISEAVASRQLTREQGEYLARERYQVAMMQFQLLSAWHAILEHAIEQAATSSDSSQGSPAGQTLVVPLPFSSLQLNPSLAQHLELTPFQIAAIENLMAQQRREIGPLMAELHATRQQLARETRNTHPDENRVRSLASTQANLLKNLIVENRRLQGKIGRLLNPEQQKKLEVLERASEGVILTGE